MSELCTTFRQALSDLGHQLSRLPDRWRGFASFEQLSERDVNDIPVVTLVILSLERQVSHPAAPLDERYQEITGHSMDSVLGTSGVNPDGFDEVAREYKRPLWNETNTLIKRARHDAASYSLLELADLVIAHGPRYLAGIANYELSEKDIWRGHYLFREFQRAITLSDNGYPEDLNEKIKQAYFTALVISDLSYAICFSERLFGPNDLGYVPDQATGLARRAEIKYECIARTAVPLVRERPTLFGDDTVAIVNGVIDRLERSRERTSNGQTIISGPYPRA